MLVLTVTERNGLVIGRGPGEVRVHVIRTKGRQVRLGIEAPRELEVDLMRVRAKMEAGSSREQAIGESEDQGEPENRTRRLCTREGLA